MSALLSVTSLRKTMGERILLDIGQLTIEAGTAYVLTGANGAGKSTLLRILGGLERPDTAQASFLGQAFALWPYPALLREAVVYVHQHPVMFSTTVAANIGYGLLARGMPGQAVHAQVEAAMDWAGVGHLRDAQPRHLSGGEKQRVALARAKVLQPRLLLLDEPTANLDGPAREQVIALIPDLTAAGSSVIMACHDRDLIGLPGMHRLKLRNSRLEQRQPVQHDHIRQHNSQDG